MLCLLRGMLLILFSTFMVCYLARTIIGGLARRFWPNQQRALAGAAAGGRLLRCSVSCCGYCHALALGPLVLNECQQLLARASNLDPDYEFHRALGGTVGAYQFHRGSMGARTARNTSRSSRNLLPWKRMARRPTRISPRPLLRSNALS